MTNRAERIANLSTTKLALLARQTYGQVEDILNAEPIAIIGIGLRFPGADDPDSYWQMLLTKHSEITEIPQDRWDMERYYDPEIAAPGKMNNRKAGFLRQVDQFDPSFFGIPEREAAQMDPQQRLVLEVVYEALDDAGLSDMTIAGSDTGFFLASFHNDYSHLIYANPDAIDLRTLTGTLHCISANRISYLLDMHGPSMALDSACSSSLTAVHLACQALRARECEICLAGGVNAILTPEINIALSKVGFISPTGECHTFDAQADGFIRGEGCGVIVLKRLSDALASGDRIFSVIRSSAINQDGRSTVLTAPNGVAQQELIKHALRNAGLHPDQIGLIEAHGTGTHLGDPLEVDALNQVLGKKKNTDHTCYLTSVKANIGHLEGAAGIAGLIKASLCLYHEAIPPQPNFTRLNPEIDLTNSPLVIPTETISWPAGEKPRYAGISSFGVGGTNAHVILGEAPVIIAAGSAVTGSADREICLLPLSARSPQALIEQVQSFRNFLEKTTSTTTTIYDIGYTAALRHTHYEYRIAVPGNTHEQIANCLSALSTDPAWLDSIPLHKISDVQPSVAFVFSGQGTQWAQMGSSLLDKEPAFRAVLEKCDEILKPLAGWSLIEMLAKPDSDSEIHQTAVAQPAIFAIQMALDSLWKSWGVSPKMVVGHSLGEVAAACSAGILSLEDALYLVYHRGRLMQQATGQGKMVSVDLPVTQVETLIAPYADHVAVAAINSSRSTVISGPNDLIDKILADLSAEGIGLHPLRVNYAFHSPQMTPYARELKAVLGGLQHHPAKVEFVSTVTGNSIPGEELNPDYWAKNIRYPVHFRDAINQMVEQDITVFLEVGPHPALSPMVEQCLADYGDAENRITVSSIRRGQPELDSLLSGLGRLFQAGVPIQWKSLYPKRGQVISLPSYSWQRKRYWIDEKKAAPVNPVDAVAGHPLLGKLVESPVFQGKLYHQTISSNQPDYLKDHQVFGQPILPAAAMLEMMLKVAVDQNFQRPFQLTDVLFHEAMLLSEGSQRTVQLHLETNDASGGLIRIFSKKPDGNWLTNTTGQIQLIDDFHEQISNASIESIRQCCTEQISSANVYANSTGVTFGPAFQGIQSIWRADGEALAKIHLSDMLDQEAGSYIVHPTILDAALQPFTHALPFQFSNDCYLPLGISNLKLLAPLPNDVWSHVKIDLNSQSAGETFNCSVTIFDEHGRSLLIIDGFTLKRVSPEGMLQIFQRQDPQITAQGSRGKSTGWFYHVDWVPLKPESSEHDHASLAGQWIIFGEPPTGNENTTHLISRQIQSAGGTVQVVLPGEIFNQNSDGQIFINPQNPEDYKTLFAQAEKNSPIQGIIYLWSLIHKEKIGSIDTSFHALRSALYLSQAVLTIWSQNLPSLWLVTAGSQPAGRSVTDPGAAALWGFANTLSLEHPDLNCCCIDLDPLSMTVDQSQAVMTEMYEVHNALFLSDRVAYQNGQRLAAQLQEIKTKSQPVFDNPVRLAFDTPGQFDTLKLQSISRSLPGEGEVEIRVFAAGLNFRDVLKVLGRYPGQELQTTTLLGDECAGVISAVGSGVEGFQPGDQVIALAEGSFATYVTVPASLILPKPASLSFQEAASLPIPFLTACYSLYQLANLARGQKVLIHAAAGGVGLAAVQLAQRVEAEIYATAGSPEKRAFLESLGVQHIYDSRSLDFAEQIRQQTGERGVDVILNSLAGDFIPASLSILAPGGSFIEIGKTGILTSEQAAQIRPDMHYHPVFLGDMFISDPDLIRAMMLDILSWIDKGELAPLPRRDFTIEQAQEAMRFMARARHIGKIVLTLPISGREKMPPERPIFRPNATYLITGGMGGIGRSILPWMAANGAKHFALVSRSGNNHSHAKAIREELQSIGAQIYIYAADTASQEELSRIMIDIQRNLPPLRGVIHAAGIVMDGVIQQQTWERYQDVLAGKSIGAWNLHMATRHLSLDHFIMFSSIAGPLGSPGQSNYAAANAFMGALAHLRRSEGLPALCIDWGVWEQTGMISRLDNAGQQAIARRGLRTIQPDSGADALGEALQLQTPECLILPVDWPTYLQETHSIKRFLFKKVSQNSGPTPIQTQSGHKPGIQVKPILVRLLEDTPAVQRRMVMINFIHHEVLRLVGLPPDQAIDPRQPLNTLGLDSLMAVEMRNSLTTALGKSLPATLLFDYPTSESLAEYLLQTLPGLQSIELTGSQGIQSSKGNTLQPETSAVQQMTDEEAEAELLAELARIKKS